MNRVYDDPLPKFLIIGCIPVMVVHIILHMIACLSDIYAAWSTDGDSPEQVSGTKDDSGGSERGSAGRKHDPHNNPCPPQL